MTSTNQRRILVTLAISLFVIAFINRLPCLYSNINKPPLGLEEIYLTQAVSFLYGKGMAFEPRLRQEIANFGTGISKAFTNTQPGPIYYLPGYPIFESIVISVIGEKMWVIRILGVLCNSIGIVLIFLALWRIAQNKILIAFLSGLLLALDQSLTPLSVLATADSVQILLIGIWLYPLARYINTRKILYLILFGFSFGMHAFFRLDFTLLILVIAFWFLLVTKKRYGMHILLAGILGITIWISPIGIRNMLYTGHFYITTAGDFVLLVGSFEGETDKQGRVGDRLVIETVYQKCGIRNLADPQFGECAKNIFWKRALENPTLYFKQIFYRGIWSFKRAFLYTGGSCVYNWLNAFPYVGPLIKGRLIQKYEPAWYIVLYDLFKITLVGLQLLGAILAIVIERKNSIVWLFLLLAIFYILFHLPMHTESRFILPARVFLVCISGIGLYNLFQGRRLKINS